MRMFEGSVRSKPLPSGLVAALDLFCQQQGVTTFMVLYAVFVTWLHRYTRESDLVVGSVVAGSVAKAQVAEAIAWVNTRVAPHEAIRGSRIHGKDSRLG